MFSGRGQMWLQVLVKTWKVFLLCWFRCPWFSLHLLFSLPALSMRRESMKQPAQRLWQCHCLSTDSPGNLEKLVNLHCPSYSLCSCCPSTSAASHIWHETLQSCSQQAVPCTGFPVLTPGSLLDWNSTEDQGRLHRLSPGQGSHPLHVGTAPVSIPRSVHATANFST